MVANVKFRSILISRLVFKGSFARQSSQFTKRPCSSHEKHKTRKLFDKNIDNPRSRRVFAELFPEVHRIFSIVRGDERGDKFKSYKRFAILLQKIESHIILNIILKRINTDQPNIIAVTIHDSIMTSIYTDHVQIVYRIMEEELFKFVGYKPTLKIE